MAAIGPRIGGPRVGAAEGATAAPGPPAGAPAGPGRTVAPPAPGVGPNADLAIGAMGGSGEAPSSGGGAGALVGFAGAAAGPGNGAGVGNAGAASGAAGIEGPAAAGGITGSIALGLAAGADMGATGTTRASLAARWRCTQAAAVAMRANTMPAAIK